MKIFVITLFPEVFEPYLASSIMKKAQTVGSVEFTLIPLRTFGLGKYKQVDDAPYGGGAGMLFRPEPLFEAVDSIVKQEGKKPKTILLAPTGTLFNQTKAKELSTVESMILICGHYEGIDDRVRTHLADEELSIGNYILTGGEIPALALIDAVVRLLPGVLPEASTSVESFSNGLLEYPQYTRPALYKGLEVPEILLSGDHAAIEKWRKDNALKRTEGRSRDGSA